MFVKPLHDHVPDPVHGGYLPPEGRHVEPGPYWWRRVADGDVTEAEPPDPPPDAAPEAAPTAPTPQSPPTAGSSVSETTQPARRRKGAQP